MEFVSRQVILSIAGFMLLVGLVAWFDNPSERSAAPTPQAPAPVSQNDIATCVWAQNVKESGFKLFWFLADKSITGRSDNVDHRDLLIPSSVVTLSALSSYQDGAYGDVLPVEARTAVNSLLEVCRELGAL